VKPETEEEGNKEEEENKDEEEESKVPPTNFRRRHFRRSATAAEGDAEKSDADAEEGSGDDEETTGEEEEPKEEADTCAAQFEKMDEDGKATWAQYAFLFKGLDNDGDDCKTDTKTFVKLMSALLGVKSSIADDEALLKALNAADGEADENDAAEIEADEVAKGLYTYIKDIFIANPEDLVQRIPEDEAAVVAEAGEVVANVEEKEEKEGESEGGDENAEEVKKFRRHFRRMAKRFLARQGEELTNEQIATSHFGLALWMRGAEQAADVSALLAMAGETIDQADFTKFFASLKQGESEEEAGTATEGEEPKAEEPKADDDEESKTGGANEEKQNFRARRHHRRGARRHHRRN